MVPSAIHKGHHNAQDRNPRSRPHRRRHPRCSGVRPLRLVRRPGRVHPGCVPAVQLGDPQREPHRRLPDEEQGQAQPGLRRGLQPQEVA